MKAFLTWLKSLFNRRKVTVENVVNTQADVTETVSNTGAASDATAVIAAEPLASDAATASPAVGGEVVPDTVTTTAAVPDDNGVLSGVRELLKAAGHEIDQVWDDAVAFARKVAAEEAELADKLTSVLKVAGHDVADIIGDAFDFAAKHIKG